MSTTPQNIWIHVVFPCRQQDDPWLPIILLVVVANTSWCGYFWATCAPSRMFGKKPLKGKTPANSEDDNGTGDDVNDNDRNHNNNGDNEDDADGNHDNDGNDDADGMLHEQGGKVSPDGSCAFPTLGASAATVGGLKNTGVL
eukprot:gene6823-2624_t